MPELMEIVGCEVRINGHELAVSGAFPVEVREMESPEVSDCMRVTLTLTCKRATSSGEEPQSEGVSTDA